MRAASPASSASLVSSFSPRSPSSGGCEKRTSSNYALRLPASLKRAVEEIAREDGTTLNQFIVSAVAEKLAVLKTADYFAKRAARADFAVFDRLMRSGEAPRPDDEIPKTSQEKVLKPAWGVVAVS
jgi:uncharacterized protein (DUF1778 family)